MSLQYRGNTLFLIVKVWDIYISCRYILLQKKLDLKVVKLYPLHSQGSFVFVHSIRIISLKMSDSTKERFYFIQNKFIWNYFYTVESTSKCNYSHKNEIHPKIVIIKRKINKDLQTLK